jgi:hypothetical protein
MPQHDLNSSQYIALVSDIVDIVLVAAAFKLASLYPITAPCLQVKDPSQILKISILSLSCGSKALGGLEVGNEGGGDQISNRSNCDGERQRVAV